MKKIALILYYYFPYRSGLSDYAKEIAEEIVRWGDYEVDIITSAYDKELPEVENINGVNVIRKKTLLTISKGILAPSMFTHVFRNRNVYEKVLVFLPMSEAGILPILINKDKIYTFYVCDIRLGASKAAKAIEASLFASMKLLLNKSKKIIPLSLDYFKASKTYKPEFEAKSTGLVPYINLSNKIKDSSIDYRKKNNIGEKTFVVGFLGRIVYEKGIDYLVNTVPLLEEMGIKDFKIIIGGDYKNIRGGSVYDDLKELIEKYKDKIIVTGFVPEEEKGNFFKSLDVFILPSIDPLEAFGIVQVEAMKYGIPVIASSLPGVREVVKKTGFGMLVKPKSSNDIADKIAQIYNNEVDLTKFKDVYKDVYSEILWKKNLKNIIQ